jgi:hypothetical protein
MRDSDPTLSDLQEALFGYHPSDLEESLITWTREHWPQAARGMIYAKKEAEDTVAIAERELVIRAMAAILPQWLEETYGLTPRTAQPES